MATSKYRLSRFHLYFHISFSLLLVVGRTLSDTVYMLYRACNIIQFKYLKGNIMDRTRQNVLSKMNRTYLVMEIFQFEVNFNKLGNYAGLAYDATNVALEKFIINVHWVGRPLTRVLTNVATFSK